jgi:hypothetical protein
LDGPSVACTRTSTCKPATMANTLRRYSRRSTVRRLETLFAAWLTQGTNTQANVSRCTCRNATSAGLCAGVAADGDDKRVKEKILLSTTSLSAPNWGPSILDYCASSLPVLLSRVCVRVLSTSGNVAGCAVASLETSRVRHPERGEVTGLFLALARRICLPTVTSRTQTAYRNTSLLSFPAEICNYVFQCRYTSGRGRGVRVRSGAACMHRYPRRRTLTISLICLPSRGIISACSRCDTSGVLLSAHGG